MNEMKATIKAPVSKVDELVEEIRKYGVSETEIEIVPYEKFMKESRFNYDFVFPEMITDEKEVAYINFYFPSDEKGRMAAWNVHYRLMQIPINARYFYEGKENHMEQIICPEKKRVVDKTNIVELKKVNDRMYILDEVNTIYMYLFVGDEKALLFDAGYGFTDFRPLLKQATNLPVTVVCSHGHDDHVLGCCLFDTAYISEKDIELCLKNDNTVQREKQILSRRGSTPGIDDIVDKEYYYRTTLKNCEFKFVKEGDVFDLGGLHIEIYGIPGHTKGSIAAYCPELKAICTGDSMEDGHKLIYGQQLAISSTPQEFIHALSKLEKLDIETVWPAHGNAPAPKKLISDTKAMLIDWALNCVPEKDAYVDTEPSPFSPPGKVHYLYHYKDMSMSYNIGHLDQIREFMAENNGAMEVSD